DPRLRPGVLLRRRGGLPRGVYDAHLDVSELPDPGLPRPRPQAGRDGGLRARAEAARPGDEPVLGDREAPAAEEDVQGAHRRGSDPRGIPDHRPDQDRKSTRLNSSHVSISYAVFCLKKKRREGVAAGNWERTV